MSSERWFDDDSAGFYVDAPSAARRPRGQDEDDEETKTRGELAKLSLELLKNQRTVLISEPVTPKLTERITTQLLWLNSQNQDPIKLFLNTPGGSADDGFAIHDMIRFIDTPVINICAGLNASAGTGLKRRVSERESSLGQQTVQAQEAQEQAAVVDKARTFTFTSYRAGAGTRTS